VREDAQRQPAQPQRSRSAWKLAELDALVAPIALYSDALLANVLMASTYSLEAPQFFLRLNCNISHKSTQPATLASQTAKYYRKLSQQLPFRATL
jgi:uncharacterized protein DUF3300